jgi:hypothetical protein
MRLSCRLPRFSISRKIAFDGERARQEALFSHARALDLAPLLRAGRLVRVVTIGAPRVGNLGFVRELNASNRVGAGPRDARGRLIAAEILPLLRVVNTGDLVPSWPSLTSGFSLDQGGVLLALPNAATEARSSGETPFGVAQRARCSALAQAELPCGTPECQKPTKVTSPAFQSALKGYHDAISRVEPTLAQLMHATFVREVSLPGDGAECQKAADWSSSVPACTTCGTGRCKCVQLQAGGRWECLNAVGQHPNWFPCPGGGEESPAMVSSAQGSREVVNAWLREVAGPSGACSERQRLRNPACGSIAWPTYGIDSGDAESKSLKWSETPFGQGGLFSAPPQQVDVV